VFIWVIDSSNGRRQCHPITVVSSLEAEADVPRSGTPPLSREVFLGTISFRYNSIKKTNASERNNINDNLSLYHLYNNYIHCCHRRCGCKVINRSVNRPSPQQQQRPNPISSYFSNTAAPLPLTPP